MKIVITGAAGFLGRELVRQLVGRHELCCLTRSVQPDLPQGDGVNWVEMNLSDGLDKSKLPPKADAIIHLAQSNGYRNFPDEAPDVFAVNIALTQALCEYGVSAGIQNMTLASTGTVYEPFEGPMLEHDALRPTGYYGASKLAAELISESYNGQFNVCNLRVFFLYGPGQEGMLIARLIESVTNGKRVSLPKDGEGLVFVPTYVGDTARTFVKAAEEGWTGVYNVASPHKASLGHLLRTISTESAQPLDLELNDQEAPSPIVPSVSKLRSKMDVEAFLDVKSGIEKTLSEI